MLRDEGISNLGSRGIVSIRNQSCRSKKISTNHDIVERDPRIKIGETVGISFNS